MPASYGAGVEGIVRGLAVDLKPVRVNMVAPGAVLTEIFDPFTPEMRENILEGMKKATLTGEVGRPESVAEAYIYILKDRFITGTVITSDGGRLLA